MKSKILNVGLLITSLLGFLEWGKTNQMFLFQAEFEMLGKLFTDPMSALHPLTMLPLLGQLLLAITLFQKEVSKRLTYSGIACLGVLLLFMFLVGVLGMNLKILASTVPFLVLSIWTIAHHRAAKS